MTGGDGGDGWDTHAHVLDPSRPPAPGRGWAHEAVTWRSGPSSVRGPGFSDPDDHRATAAMIELAAAGHAWVTVSGACRQLPGSSPAAARAALAPRVRALVEAVPDRLLWASDWPHVGLRANGAAVREIVRRYAVPLAEGEEDPMLEALRRTRDIPADLDGDPWRA